MNKLKSLLVWWNSIGTSIWFSLYLCDTSELGFELIHEQKESVDFLQIQGFAFISSFTRKIGEGFTQTFTLGC